MTVCKTFEEKHMDQIKQLAAYYRKGLLEDIVPFWEQRVVDREKGGYYNCFDKKGNLYKDIKPGWFVGRNLYIFSALYNKIEKRPEWLEIAAKGKTFLMEKAYAGEGRFNYMMDRDGVPIEGTTSIFTDHFAVKGLFEYAKASGSKEDAELAISLYEKLMEHVSDRSLLEKEGLDPRFIKHAHNFMTLLVAIEGKSLLGDRAKSTIDVCMERSLYTFVDDDLKAPLEYVGITSKPLYEDEGRLIDPGHTLEAMWFCMTEGIERKDKAIISRAAQIIDWVIDRGWDEEYGGFYQYVDVLNGLPEEKYQYNTYVDIDVHWSDKIWWVQAEALYATALSALCTKNERHFEIFMKQHEFCKKYMADHEFGEWRSFVHRDGSPFDDRKGFELKGPYHVMRAYMMLTLLFENYVH